MTGLLRGASESGGASSLLGNAAAAPDISTQAAPNGISSILWELSTPAERTQLLAQLTPATAQAGVVMTGVATATLPQAATVSVDIAALLNAARGFGPLAATFTRFGVMTMPLMLSGDTPKPPAQETKFGDLTLVMTAPAAFKKIGDPGTTAHFVVDKPGWIHLGSGQTKLAVPVQVQGGKLSFDLTTLQKAYGKALPPGILAMAGRPAGVPAALQTNPSTLAKAMAGAPDPCKNAGGQQHHIIPAELMVKHQQFLTRINFVLDQPANIIRLPGDAPQRSDMEKLCGELRPLHRGRHPDAHKNAISDKLSQIENRMNSGQLSPAQARGEVNRLMSEIRAELSSTRHAMVNDISVANFIRMLKF